MPKISFLISPKAILETLRNPKMISRGFEVVKNTMLGKETPIDNNDRYVLEKIIIPYFVEKEEFTKVLFVGCGSYTKHYEKWFKDKQEYWTIDINPLKKIYGAKNHIVDSSSNLNSYFQDNYLDLIICNGVFGHGLNDKEDVEKAYGGCYQSLRDGGVLIIGWDDLPESKPFDLETCESINRFKSYVFPPKSTSQISTAQMLNLTDPEEKHIYNFYIK